MNLAFYLDDDLEIGEPIGFADLEISMKRDDTFHGMTFEASTSTLQFYGDAYDYLKGKYETEGVKANVKFTALEQCDGYDYTTLLEGRLNFGKYKESCGNVCMVSLPVEEDSCAVIINSRKEHKVDLDKITAADGISALSQYGGLGVETELPAHNLLAQTEGYVLDTGDEINLDIFVGTTSNFAVRPTYGRIIYESIEVSQLVPSVYAASDNGFNDSAISPIVLLDDLIDCFDGEFDYEVRLKGSYDYGYDFTTTIHSVRLVVAYGEYPGSLTELHSQVLASFPGNTAQGTFDYSYSGSLTLPQGQGFYAYFESEAGVISFGLFGTVTFDQETYVNFQGVRSCPSTEAELYYIHETLSRITESVTNNCARVKSSYYGRTDSEPFAFPVDGCGGLRAVTSGLKIRRAEEDKYFETLKNLLEGLNAIDNIGFDLIPDPDLTGGFLMRVEDVDFFYRDEEVLIHDGIPDGDMQVEEKKHYSRVQVGYKKWEVEGVNGLDEFNSQRQYTTSIETIDSELNITSNLIAGSYPIEITRQQSFADSGGADTKYDNDTFIICLERLGYPYGNLIVEQGNVTNGANFYSPSTVYNFRLSPVRNLMRWYKTIVAGFVNIFDSASQLFFSSGTGNFTARGKVTDENCRIENTEIQENQNIFTSQFASADDFTPLWKNELLSYQYSMSIKDYRVLKQNPYGYISTQCGNGDYKKHWIKEIKYKPAKGTATFVVRRKYGS